MVTPTSPFVSSFIIIAICISCVFSIITFIGIIYRWKHIHLISINYKNLLFVIIVSGLSCLFTLIFLLDDEQLNLLYKFQLVIIQIVYLSQSIIPFVIITQRFINIEYTKQIAIIYTIISCSWCIIVVSSDIKDNLALISNIVSESIFIIIGFTMYYNISIDDNSIPIVPYILIRPIIIAFTIPVICMDTNNQQSVNYFAGYMTFSIISISMIAILTMVFPLIFNENNVLRKNGYDMPSGNPKFDDHIHTFSEQQATTIGIKYNESKPISTKYIHASDHDDKHGHLNKSNNWHLSPRLSTNGIIEQKSRSTLLRVSTTNNPYQSRDTILSMPSLPPESVGGNSFVSNRRDTNEPDYIKNVSADTHSSTTASTTMNTSTANTITTDTLTQTESTKYSHHESVDTNKVLGGSTLEEINETDEVGSSDGDNDDEEEEVP